MKAAACLKLPPGKLSICKSKFQYCGKRDKLESPRIRFLRPTSNVQSLILVSVVIWRFGKEAARPGSGERDKLPVDVRTHGVVGGAVPSVFVRGAETGAGGEEASLVSSSSVSSTKVGSGRGSGVDGSRGERREGGRVVTAIERWTGGSAISSENRWVRMSNSKLTLGLCE